MNYSEVEVSTPIKVEGDGVQDLVLRRSLIDKFSPTKDKKMMLEIKQCFGFGVFFVNIRCSTKLTSDIFYKEKVFLVLSFLMLVIWFLIFLSI